MQSAWGGLYVTPVGREEVINYGGIRDLKKNSNRK